MAMSTEDLMEFETEPDDDSWLETSWAAQTRELETHLLLRALKKFKGDAIGPPAQLPESAGGGEALEAQESAKERGDTTEPLDDFSRVESTVPHDDQVRPAEVAGAPEVEVASSEGTAESQEEAPDEEELVPPAAEPEEEAPEPIPGPAISTFPDEVPDAVVNGGHEVTAEPEPAAQREPTVEPGGVPETPGRRPVPFRRQAMPDRLFGPRQIVLGLLARNPRGLTISRLHRLTRFGTDLLLPLLAALEQEGELRKVGVKYYPSYR